MATGDRAINVPEGIVFGTKVYKPGSEDSLAKVAPQTIINEMVGRGWLSGDWSDVGVTAEQVDEAAEKAATAAAKKKAGK